MQSAKPIQKKAETPIKMFDGFTKVMLITMFTILIFIFISGKYMESHNMAAGGTDDKVNNLASQVSKTAHHPFVQLPGDAQLGAFSVANFFAGLIVGHHWEKLFGKNREIIDNEDNEEKVENIEINDNINQQ